MIKLIINESSIRELIGVGDLRRHYKTIGSSTEIPVMNDDEKLEGIIVLYIDDEPKNHYVYYPKQGIEYHIITVCVNDEAENFKFDLNDDHFENHILLFTSSDSEDDIIEAIDNKIVEIKYQILQN